jgi:hypothetical protein
MRVDHVQTPRGVTKMSRFLTLTALALVPASAQAQIYYGQPPVVMAPVYSAPVITSYYPAPVVPAPSISYYAAPATYSYYPPTTVYAAPPAVVYPGGGYTTRTYQGFGIFRPRGTYTETYYTPSYLYAR